MFLCLYIIWCIVDSYGIVDDIQYCISYIVALVALRTIMLQTVLCPPYCAKHSGFQSHQAIPLACDFSSWICFSSAWSQNRIPGTQLIVAMLSAVRLLEFQNRIKALRRSLTLLESAATSLYNVYLRKDDSKLLVIRCFWIRDKTRIGLPSLLKCRLALQQKILQVNRQIEKDSVWALRI